MIYELHTRMIHELHTHTHLKRNHHQAINSIDRRQLNEVLLTEAQKHKNVKLYFEHKLVEMSSDGGEATFENVYGARDILASVSIDVLPRV